MTRRLAAVPDSPRRGVGLIRVSKAKGREDLTSPELQRIAITDYAARSGITITAWVEALDESGSTERSAWWRTLETVVGQVEARDVDVVVVWRYSRLARHRRRWATAIDRIEVAGGTIESATEGLDTTTSTGRLARGMLAELSAWEAERIGEAWKETHARRRNAGLPAQGGDRFGYDRTAKDTYTPNPKTSVTLASMYARYIAGAGFMAIADELNQAGVPTLSGGVWTKGRVTKVLDSGFGAAQLIQGKGSRATWVPAAHPPVIDAETWRAYQQARRRRAVDAPAVTEPVYVLSGLIKCGDCGAPMHASRLGREAGYGYICSRWNRSKVGRCVTVSRAKAEQAVLDYLRQITDDLDGAAARNAERAASQAVAKADATALSRQILRLDERLAKLTRGWTEGLVPDLAYKTTRDELQAEKDRCNTELLRLETEHAWRAAPSQSVARGLLEEWDSLPVRERRGMLQSLIRSVQVIRPDKGRVRVEVEPL